jgi:L-amino acid N-acyltransferase YncA
VSAADSADFAWLVGMTQCAPTAGMTAIKATDANGKIRGMVGYDGWTESAVFAHMAVDTPVAWRSLIPACFEYPFNACGKHVLMGVIPSHNTASWGLAKHLGFRIAYAIRDGWAMGDDLLVLEMRRENCRFLRS